MTITSVIFFITAVLAAIVYRQLLRKWRNYWLLILSIGFIITWSWQFAILLSLFALVNFSLGLKIGKVIGRSRGWVLLGIGFNIFFLLILKYNSFYLPAFENRLVSWGIIQSAGALSVLVPVGLSFLVVQTISYLADVSKKLLLAERDPLKFGIYILYFPKLLSGPVERTRLFLPRLESPQPFDRELFDRSISLILTGLFRKLVFANPIFTMIPESAFTTPQIYAGQHLVVWLLAYAFALFNDFAGYTSIVRGVSLWFGIELTNNFNLPYFARNFTEFWNRWHISLSNWLRDYIFFPLSRTLLRRYPERNHFFNLVIPPMVTLFVSGLWHGLSWGLLVWGGLHGLYLVLERLPSLFYPTVPISERPRWRQWLGIALTFSLTLLAWVPFKMNLPVAIEFWSGMFKWVRPDWFLFSRYITGDAEFLSWTPLNIPNPLLLVVLAGAIGYDVLVHQENNEKELRNFSRAGQIVFVLILLTFILFSVFSDTTAPFVYQGF